MNKLVLEQMSAFEDLTHLPPSPDAQAHCHKCACGKYNFIPISFIPNVIACFALSSSLQNK